MLVSCCDDVHEERGLSLSNPDCCDEISLPASDKEFVDQFTVPAFVAVKQKGFHPEFFFGFSVQSEGRSKQPYQARGPPPDGPALYIYYCSYLI
jgi:hypothetical protein